MGQAAWRGYKARDTKLGRDVAIKVLPDAFVSDPEWVARFQREAQGAASLNHPSIGGIYGLEESGSVTALVMELVEGEDFSQRIARGAIPIDEALRAARQFAEALEAAHEQGIIHRDRTREHQGPRGRHCEGAGLRSCPSDGARRGSSSSASMSPTITTPAMTGAVSFSARRPTWHPNRRKGKSVDKRADIWAFGAVLFEMLTGTRAFDGEDVGDTLAAVLRADPDWNALPAEVGFPVRTRLRGCLESIHGSGLRILGGAVRAAPSGDRSGSGWAGWTRTLRARTCDALQLLTTAVLLLGIAAAGAGVWWLTRPVPPSVVRSTLTTSGLDRVRVVARESCVAITPDGSRVVYRGDNQLPLRAPHELEPRR